MVVSLSGLNLPRNSERVWKNASLSEGVASLLTYDFPSRATSACHPTFGVLVFFGPEN